MTTTDIAFQVLVAERDAALQEVERLKTEVNCLKLTELQVGWLALPKKDFDEIQAKVERLKAAHRDYLVELRDIVTGYGNVPPTLWRVQETLDAALASTPQAADAGTTGTTETEK